MNCDRMMKELVLNNFNHTFAVNCGNYTFKEVKSFGLSLNLETEATNKKNCKNSVYEENLLMNPKCSFDKTEFAVFQQSAKVCFGKSNNCQFSANMASLNSKCFSEAISKKLNYAFFTYKCERT